MKRVCLKCTWRALTPPVLFGLFILAGCQRSGGLPKADDFGKSTAPASSTVTSGKPVRKTIRHNIEQPGEIQAFEQTPMYARISGFVETVAKDIGDRVEKDEVLIELSVPEMVEEHQQKKALAEQAAAEVEQAKSLRAAAEAGLLSAAAKVTEVESTRQRAGLELRRAESQYERMKKSSGVISPEFIEENKLSFESAQATVAEIEARVKSAEAVKVEAAAKRDKADADVRVADARLRVAQAEERREAELLRYSKLRAPFKGVVVRRNVDPGHLLLAAVGAGGKGEPVFVVAQTETVRVFVDVPENDAVLVADGTPAVVSVQALKGEQFKGVVQRSAWALNPKARTLRTEIDVKNPDGRLRPGMYAYAVISPEHANVLSLPVAAVVTQGEQTFCYRLEAGKAVRTPIKIGFRDGQFVEVMKKQTEKDANWVDFTGDEEVVTGGAATLTDGQAMTVAHAP
jgi:HlyD family secretion protein